MWVSNTVLISVRGGRRSGVKKKGGIYMVVKRITIEKEFDTEGNMIRKKTIIEEPADMWRGVPQIVHLPIEQNSPFNPTIKWVPFHESNRTSDKEKW